MFGRIGTMELILILVIALIIFGPSKLPQIGKSLGSAIGQFKSQTSKITEGLNVDLGVTPKSLLGLENEPDDSADPDQPPPPVQYAPPAPPASPAPPAQAAAKEPEKTT